MAAKNTDFDYPEIFTDKSWKAQEKRLGVSATGLGEQLRAMEKSSVKLGALAAKIHKAAGNDLGLTPREAQPLDTARAAHLKLITATWKVTVKLAGGATGKSAAVGSFAEHFAEALKAYQDAWKGFEPADDRGLVWAIEEFNLTLTKRRGDFNI